MEACLKDVLHHLPVGEGRWRLRTKGKTGVFAHHYDAHTGFWNQEIRFDPLPELQKDACTVWEVGAHENAADSAELLEQYPKCTYHAYEPIPVFYNKLSKKWANEKRVVTHNYGLADKDGSFTVSEDALKGQSTYIAEGSATSGKTMTANIRSFDFALSEAGGQVPDLLHMNCEGCEWDMIPQAKRAGFLDKIPVINLGVHNYPNDKLGERSVQLCEMRSLLTETHDMVKGVPFGWERWVLRNSNEPRLA
jgi:FkbM family methyltransferase